MSAYGTISRSSNASYPLPSTIWIGRTGHVTIHHLRLASAPSKLVEYLSNVFAQEVEDGRTYPQEGPFDLESFEKYFFAEDLFVAIIGKNLQSSTDGAEIALSIDEARNGRSWEECVAGCYYVKPNYPGRSAHICNGGFLVPPVRRKGGYGSTLAKSYVHYAPKLGYRASVFNLVYINNEASVKLWERLGFTKAGRIPQAGRLKREDGKGEEYVDAWVIYKSFMNEDLPKAD